MHENGAIRLGSLIEVSASSVCQNTLYRNERTGANSMLYFVNWYFGDRLAGVLFDPMT